MRLLALDLGTTTAYALGDTSEDWPTEIGSWNLGCRDDAKADVEINWINRVDRMNDALYWITSEWKPEMIAYEAGFVSLAHKPKDIAFTLEAADAAMKAAVRVG